METWKIVGYNPPGNTRRELDQCAGCLRGECERTVITLTPLKCRGERINYRLYAALGCLGVKVARG